MENTMIQIKKDTANKLKDLKKYERETYDEIINKIIIALEEDIIEDNLDLSEETKRKLAIASKTPLSEYIDHEKVKKQLLQ